MPLLKRVEALKISKTMKSSSPRTPWYCMDAVNIKGNIQAADEAMLNLDPEAAYQQSLRDSEELLDKHATSKPSGL